MTNASRVRIPLLALLLCHATGSVGEGQIDDPVRITGGLLAGVSAADPEVRVFRGVPFAAPPVGELRWPAPQPAEEWTGVRSADVFAPGCVQQVAGSRPPWTEEFMHQGEVGEDCLYLNVWSAADSPAEQRPVLVYIHGGGFNEGSGSVAAYDGAALARKGLVVVTINYRLGLLGFFTHPELAAEAGNGPKGNWGLLDQVAALRWVRENIAAFGGDPENVTVAGQSAGAISVYLLTASPFARGLFQRAIVQSGPGALSSGLSSTATLAQPLEGSLSAGAEFAVARGARSIGDLRSLSVEALLAPSPAAPTRRFGVVIDGVFLPATVPAVYARGAQNDVPMLMGMNADEPSASAGYGTHTAAEFRADAETRYGSGGRAFLELYPASTDLQAGLAQRVSLRDAGLVGMGRVAAERAAAGTANTYMYLLERGIPWPERPEFGAFHTSEVPYVFNNLDMLPRPWTPLDREIADVMSSYWANFAATGDPNGGGLPRWDRYLDASDAVLVFGESIRMRALLAPARRAFFESRPAGAARR